jgi:hypothetical protein
LYVDYKYIYQMMIWISSFVFRLVHKNLKDTKIGRGVNVVAIDGETFDVKLIDTFDTYSEGRRTWLIYWWKKINYLFLENFFLRTLKLNLNNGDIIILASYDEMTYG